MKTEYCIYRDVEYEDKTRGELENSRRELQSLLNAWNSLNIGKCRDIYTLLMRTERLYTQVIDTLVTVPAGNGPFAVNKTTYVQSLNLPDPSALYGMAKRIRQIGYCAVPALWCVSDDGGTVEILESEAEIFIDRMSLYTSDTEKIRMAKDLQHACDVLNELNKRLGVQFSDFNQWANGKFIIRELSLRGDVELSIDRRLFESILKK